MPTHDRAPDPVTLAAVGIGYREMLAISRESDAWRFRPGTPDRWIQTETGEVVTAATPEGVPDDYVYVRPDEEVGDEYDVVESDSGGTYRSPNPTDGSDSGSGSDADSGDADGMADAAQFDSVPDAGPSALAGGVAAAIDDDRSDFHDIRNGVTRADSRGDALDILTSELTQAQASDLIEEVADQQRIRDTFDEVDDPSTLSIGQEILYDADRPKRGTVDDVDADGTVWLYQPDRDLRSGISPEFGTLLADPEHESDGGQFTADPGRYGLASNPDVLENAFEAAANVQGSREAGIMGGNTTGDKMKILDMPDGSRVFATPVDAYPGTTGVVKSRAEAKKNNLNSPTVIESLGGTAANTRLTEGPGGREYIAKEGIDGGVLSDYTRGRGDKSIRALDEDAIRESATETMAAAYFVGNVDLHSGNLAISEATDEVAIIDHDSAGYSNSALVNNQVQDLSRYGTGPPGLSTPDARERIYDKAQQIRSGDVDLGVMDNSDHGRYAKAAADKATRAAYVDPAYDLPDDQTPAELQFPPSGIETVDDFEDPNDVPEDAYDIDFVAFDGEVTTGLVTDIVDKDGEKTLMVDTGSFDVEEITDPNRVTEIK